MPPIITVRGKRGALNRDTKPCKTVKKTATTGKAPPHDEYGAQRSAAREKTPLAGAVIHAHEAKEHQDLTPKMHPSYLMYCVLQLTVVGTDCWSV
jgi:hypothetical protein